MQGCGVMIVLRIWNGFLHDGKMKNYFDDRIYL